MQEPLTPEVGKIKLCFLWVNLITFFCQQQGYLFILSLSCSSVLPLPLLAVEKFLLSHFCLLTFIVSFDHIMIRSSFLKLFQKFPTFLVSSVSSVKISSVKSLKRAYESHMKDKYCLAGNNRERAEWEREILRPEKRKEQSSRRRNRTFSFGIKCT